MLSKKIKLLTKIGVASILGIGAIAIPVFSTINFSTNPTSFDEDKIGVYFESSWVPTFELAVEKYYDLPGEQTPIQILETPSVFQAMELVDTLGYRDQVVPDLMYFPIDRIPQMAERDKALLYFDTPDELLEGFDPKIWSNNNETKEEFAKKGLAKVNDVNGEKVEGYFGVIHNIEALVMFSKGDFQNRAKYPTLESIVDATDWEPIAVGSTQSREMYGFNFKDLWHGIGIVGAFLNTKSGEALGKAFVSINENVDENAFNQKYYSAMTTINPVESQPYYDNLSLTFPDLKNASQNLSDAVEFVFEIYDKAYQSNAGNWHVSDYGRWRDKFTRATDAALVSGVWDAANIRGTLEDPNSTEVIVQAVPNPTATSGQYAQGPGGWVWGINQRNYGDEKRIADMKAFMNILLTDEDLIKKQYLDINKIPAGDFSKNVLVTEPDFTPYDKSVIEATFTSLEENVLDFRPDAGNFEFNQVWGSWDGNSFGSTQATDIYRSGKDFESKVIDMKNLLEVAFENMLTRLETSGQ